MSLPMQPSCFADNYANTLSVARGVRRVHRCMAFAFTQFRNLLLFVVFFLALGCAVFLQKPAQSDRLLCPQWPVSTPGGLKSQTQGFPGHQNPAQERQNR